MNNKGKNPPRQIFSILLNFALGFPWVLYKGHHPRPRLVNRGGEPREWSRFV